MKKYLILILIPLAGIILSSCNSTDTTNPPSVTKGSIFVQSTPLGASIAVGGSSTGKVTPDSVTNLDEGSYNVTLSLTNYKDTTFSASVTAGFQTVVPIVQLTSDLTTSTFMDTIWETTGTGADQPSGLDLSAGVAKSSSNSDVDIYYYSNSGGTVFEIRSSSSRSTSFLVGSSTNLFDGTPSPLATNSWGTTMGDRETNYVFLFDADSHYSNLIIKSYGGGTTGSPAYLIVQWIYNSKANDVRFPTQP